MFEDGLLLWGFDRCARLLDFVGQDLLLTNRVIGSLDPVADGLAAVVELNDVTKRWEMIQNGVVTFGMPFPYGRRVEPP